MVITCLESYVSESKWGALEDAFQAHMAALPPGLVDMYLLRGTMDPTLWRIVAMWQSREVLSAHRSQGESVCTLIFGAAGVQARLSIWEVTGHVAAA